jgi:hypothetical protein
MTDTRPDAARIGAHVQQEERIAREIDERVLRRIVGPDGKPLLEAVIDDRTITYAKDGESAQLEPEQFLMRAARMQRDGASLKRIRSELELVGDISDEVLQNALNLGHEWLNAAIREGREPAESRLVVGYAFVLGDDD